MAINTNAYSQNNVSNIDRMPVPKTDKSKNESAADSFADFMNASMKGVSNGTIEENKSTNKVSNDYSYAVTNDQADKSNVNEESKANKNSLSNSEKQEVNKASESSNKKNNETDKIQDSKSVDKENVETSIDEEDIEKVSSVIQDILQILQDMLGVSEDEINEIMEQFDIQSIDLLDMDNIKSMILSASDATEIDMLVDEGLASLVNEITEDITNLIEDADIKNIVDTFKGNDEFGKMMEAKVASQDEMKESTSDQNLVENIVTNTDDNSDKVISDGRPSTSSEQNDANQSNSMDENMMMHLNDALNQVAMEDVESVDMTKEMQEADIVRQLIDDIKANITEKTTSLSVQLNPENLGKVQINVVQKDGSVSAQIIAENELAKNAIENSIAALKEAFDNQNLKVDAVEVMIADYEFFNQDGDQNLAEQNDNQNANNQNKSNKNLNLDDDFVEDELSEEQKIQISMMRAQGNKLNYSV